jgi:L-alanine-DL-glutamate epimerase-like enolase superfamily enzyme
MKVKGLEILRCDAGWRNYHFLKLTTDEGVIGWSEFDEGFGSPGVSAVIERLAGRVVGQPVFDHERIYTELYCFTRPAAGGVVAEGLGAIENALLDAKAKALGVPCHALLGGKVRDRIQVYWSHCATWRINHPTLYKPAITSLDGVKAIGAEVRERGFSALKTNIFIYDGGTPRGWRPGFGVPFMPELNVDKPVLRNLRAHLEAIRDGAGPNVDLLLDLNFNAKTEGYLKSCGRSPISRCSGSRSIVIAPRRSLIFAGRARTRSAHAKPSSGSANSCLISASRRWMSRSSMRCGTGSGNR